MEKTEGWIAGLQLAALSIQGRRNNHKSFPDFPEGQRHILDYLTEEVLNQQDQEIKEFLLKTSVLEKMTPPLCDALLGNTDSRAILETLEQRNLFLIPLDGQRTWYRYHALFGDLLRTQLQNRGAQIVTQLHMIAYQWLIDHDYPEQAVTHALAAGNTRLAAETVESCALQAIIRMDISTVVRWFKLLPQEIISQRLRLVIYEVMVNFLQGKVDDMEERLVYVEGRLADISLQEIDAQEAERLTRYITAVRAAALCTQGDFSRGLDSSQQVLENLQPEDYYFYGLIEHYMAYAYHAAGRLSEAAAVLEKACQNALSHDFHNEFVISLSEKARFFRLQGRLREAAQAYTLAVDYAKTHEVGEDILICPQAGLAEILREWNQIEEADKRLVRSLRYLTKSPGKILDWFFTIDICLAVARNRMLHEDFPQAAQFIQMAHQSAQEYHFVPELVPEVNSVRVDFWLACGELEPALEWADEKLEQLQAPAHDTRMKKVPNLERLAMAKVYLAADKLDCAESLISELLAKLAGGEQKDQLVRAHILKAMLQVAARLARSSRLYDRAGAYHQRTGRAGAFILGCRRADAFSAW